LLLNEAQKLLVHIQSTSIHNNSFDITAIDHSHGTKKTHTHTGILAMIFYLFLPSVLDDRPDPLRIPEVLIVVCVLLLWCASIYIFIRHSELLRIRHRDIPYRSSIKPPMNLNHVTIVHRTSDMIIHSKPRISGGSNGYNQSNDDYEIPEIISSSTSLQPVKSNKNQYSTRERAQTVAVESSYSISNDRYLNPCKIPVCVRRSLLDLHRDTMVKTSTMRYSMSYSTNDVSRRQKNTDVRIVIDDRGVQESPV